MDAWSMLGLFYPAPGHLRLCSLGYHVELWARLKLMGRLFKPTFRRYAFFLGFASCALCLFLPLARQQSMQAQQVRKPAPPRRSFPNGRQSPASDKVTFADISIKLGITLTETQTAPDIEAPKAVTAGEYSLEFARRRLVPLFGPSLAIGDYDGDGNPDLYFVNPAGGNQLLHNNGDGTLSNVTDKAGGAGPGATLSAAFADYDNSGHPSLFLAGLGGVRLYRNNGNGRFSDETERAGLRGAAARRNYRSMSWGKVLCPCECWPSWPKNLAKVRTGY